MSYVTLVFSMQMGKQEYAVWSTLNTMPIWHMEYINNVIYIDVPSMDMEISHFLFQVIESALMSDGKDNYDVSETTYPDHISIEIVGKKTNHLYDSIVKYDKKNHSYPPRGMIL